MGFLLDNILQQRAQIQAMGKTPTKLVCDPDTWDVLCSELPPISPLFPVTDPVKIYGLELKFSKEPNFEVV